MKDLFFLLLLSVISLSTFAQQITGEWNGMLKVQAGIQLRLVFHIEQHGDAFSATMDSPDQGAKGIPISSVTFGSRKLTLRMPNLMAEYNGTLQGDSITGIFQQRGMTLPLNLSRQPVAQQTAKRPQEPIAPYPYHSEEVTFPNTAAAITLAGTLTLPQNKGIYPVAILITGSGPQDRNEEVFGHKPFLVLADYLTRHGIAVLRYDDRGVAKSTGIFGTATTADFATDVESAVAYLKTRKEVDQKKIGLIGHSEGGIIAPMIAAKEKDIRFIVLLAGTGIRGDKLLLLQEEQIARASGMAEKEITKAVSTNKQAFNLILNTNNQQTTKEQLTKLLTELARQEPDTVQQKNEMQQIPLQVNQMTSPWMQFFLQYDPAPTLVNVQCPVLALNGEKDLQVAAKENIPAIENALKKGGNKTVTVKILPNLNHLFQECKTGLPTEYASIEQTMSPAALETITSWIKQTVH